MDQGLYSRNWRQLEKGRKRTFSRYIIRPFHELFTSFFFNQELYPSSFFLMTDVFGNYVIQKLLEHGSDEQRSQLMMKVNTIL